MARIRRPLHTRFGTVRAKTQFGEPVWVPVLHRRGSSGTLLVPLGASGRAVTTSLRPLALRWSRIRVVVDLGSSRLTVSDGRHRLGTFPIGQGAPESPTPAGRFFVTDRIAFPVGSPYAPYALGISAHQTHLAPTWIGGDQIAIHAGPMGAISNGCIHVGYAAITLLRRTAALGTLVVVKK
jgi:lipoprotein-anchoring transpeptidase ErfK/SrfK